MKLCEEHFADSLIIEYLHIFALHTIYYNLFQKGKCSRKVQKGKFQSLLGQRHPGICRMNRKLDCMKI